MPGRLDQESGRKVQEMERKARSAGRDCDNSGRSRRIPGRRRELTHFAPGIGPGMIIPRMKIFLGALACAGLLAMACTSRATAPGGNVPPPKPVDPPQLAPTRTSEIVKPAQPVLALASNHADGFAASVRPVLTAHCAPCHEPGGKMYDRLPFDKGETIASHRDGVLKRLKGDDRAAVETWLSTLPDAATP